VNKGPKKLVNRLPFISCACKTSKVEV
jgi:hypothetical protein